MRLFLIPSIRVRRAAIAVLALCAFVGSDALDAVHRLSVRHVACSDHAGELTEMAGVPVGHEHLDDRTLCEEAPPNHGHDHCRLLLPALAAPSLAMSVAVVAVAPAVVDTRFAVAAPRVSARWRVAPKTSPPV